MSDKYRFMLVLLIVAIIICLVLWIIAAIGSMKLTDGCLLRYNLDENGKVRNSDSVTNTVTLKANGNYSVVENGSNYVTDETAYGKWLNTNFNVKGGQVVKFKIKGDVSLCKAYLPDNNLQAVSGKTPSGDKIEIPRTEDKSAAPLTLYMDSALGQWRNLTQLFRNDQFVVSIMPDRKTTGLVTMKNAITSAMITADCNEGKTSYNPICGRYTVWQEGTYTQTCRWEPECTECNCHEECDSWDVFDTGWCILGWKRVCEWCGCYKNVTAALPEPYSFDGKYTSPWRASVSELYRNFRFDCATDSSYILGDFQNEKYFWFSADNAAGLLYRYETSAVPSNPTTEGSNFMTAKIANDQSFHQNGENYKILLNEVYEAENVGYLQFRIANMEGAFQNNSGGYVLNIKQTKCRRSNGRAMNDTLEGRGLVEYVLMPYGKDPNANSGLSPQSLEADNDGNGQFTVPGNINAYLWLKIKNDQEDYKDSFGQYQVQIFGEIPKGSFFHDILDPLFTTLKSKIRDASVTIFKNMTCYQGIGSSNGSSSNCTNFFNYIRGLLTLYVMTYGFLFLLGMVEISQTDLVIRVIKIALVAGLLNEKSFDFFNNYIFLTVTEFSDSIISNISGYSLFTTGGPVSNPFIFLNEVLTKIFLSKTFGAQLMALIAMGINGVLYFIIIVITLVMVVITAFRAIAVYLMAFAAIAVLIGIAPLFLTFMLFNFTFYLFDNWVKFTVRYMLEPVIMLAGIIILTQLFTIYLDYVIGYSVCWKCAMPLQIPFPNIPGFNPAFLEVPLFCINWFAPWGFDHFGGVMGINIAHIVALMIIGYCLWGYIEFAGKITSRLTGGVGGPSATAMGQAMSADIENKALKNIGLDAASRNAMKKAAKERLQNMTRKGGNTNYGQDKADKKPTNREGEEKSGSSLQGNEEKRKASFNIGGHNKRSIQHDQASGSATSGGKKAPKPLPKRPTSGQTNQASGSSAISSGGKKAPKPLPKRPTSGQTNRADNKGKGAAAESKKETKPAQNWQRATPSRQDNKGKGAAAESKKETKPAQNWQRATPSSKRSNNNNNNIK